MKYRADCTLRTVVVRGALAALLLCLAQPASGQVSAYEWVFQSGPNNVLDSNASSCDSSEGCFNFEGKLCSSDAGGICNLQIVPKGRCTYGNLGPTGGPGGSNTCVWPHGAGQCAKDSHIGCLADSYIADPGNTQSGPSAMCGGTECVMERDVFNGSFRPECSCTGATPQDALANELSVCGSPNGICSDGDPDRATGGFGLALGMEWSGAPFPPPNPTVLFPALGPSVNGMQIPTTSPRYPIENPPVFVFAQRDAGSINHTPAGVLGPIHVAKTRVALERSTLDATLGVEKLRGFGNSFWADWSSDPNQTAMTSLLSQQTFAVPVACDPPVGWTMDAKLDPTPGAPNSGDEGYCSQLSSDSVTILWRRDLTPAEQAAHPSCPPTCGKDFDLTTTETEALFLAHLQDRNAGLQLSVQSGEGRPAGAGDSISSNPLILMLFVTGSDVRCRLGGWGNASGFVGRCSDGPLDCQPGDPANGDARCAAASPSQGQCRACNGPIDYANTDDTNGLPNSLGEPPGYSSHGLSALDLDKSERIGGLAGVAAAGRIPLFLVGTSGYAASDFRDLPGIGAGSKDVADLGEVDPFGDPFAVGIGSGGTFTNGSTLPIGATCCAGGVNVSWSPAQVGSPVASFLRSFDSGPGLDGIPGCFGDNSHHFNGATACDERLGQPPSGPKTDGFYATGLDDVPISYTVGSSGSVPASNARFAARWPVPANCTLPAGSKPVFNQVQAMPFRDLNYFTATANLDVMIKLDVSYCPAVGANGHDCSQAAAAPDADCDGVADSLDDCPDDANPGQGDADADGVGDVCDNCTAISNPRVPANFVGSNPWATLTGGQRDDDHDGFGNKCDADFTVGGVLVGTADLTQFRASTGKSRTVDTCGTNPLGPRPCAIFDLDEVSAVIGTGDLTQFRVLAGKAAGPKCPTCPKACTAGTAGSCLP